MNKNSDAVPVPFIKLFGKNPGWEKALKTKILAGKFILTSTSGWLWGADIIFPQKLIINQKTLSDCQNITGGDIQSLLKFFSLGTPELIYNFLLLTEREEVKGGRGSTTGTSAPTTPPGPTPLGTEVWRNVRLPDNIVPVHYDVVLYIDLKKLVFFGDVSILVNVTKPTENVLVHFNKMNITSAKVEMASSGGEKNVFSFIDRLIKNRLKGKQYIIPPD